MDGLGIVVIGRNEGDRLKACLASLPADVPTVYVDSGSTDGSVPHAYSVGAAIVELDAAKPFSAARARNDGAEKLKALHPDLRYLQVIDGDCELLPGWLETAIARLDEAPDLAVVAGLRRERFPQESWYNQLCAYEWDTPVGEAAAVGGDALYRFAAFGEVGGFDPMMMAGEEPELCLRLRRAGYRVERLDHDMTLHDADIHSFEAWWKRAVRSGYAYTLGLMKHGREGYCVREVLRALVWGGGLPLLALLFLLFGFPLGTFLLIGLYALKWYRMRRRFVASTPKPGRRALFLILTNIAEVFGIGRAFRESLTGDRSILEYKR
jgi:GT2 family glycosyltransferase